MQIDTSNTVQVSSNVTADGTMSLDSEGMEHLIQVLTNLYSDKHLAVLREYSTNALDAHVAAGNPDPIRVTLPTSLNPTLVISDSGVGLSKDELLGIYSRYGASSKRGTNLQVGSFGLGSKSAFTIGAQFIVTARKDGMQVSAVFAMNSSGVGTVNILAEHETDEANGVTVTISISDPWKMQEAASKFFRAWKPGTVLVDGEQPESFYTEPDAMWLTPDLLFTKKGGITVVMGSVAYPLPYSAVRSVREWTGLSFPLDGAGLTVFLPIGAVDITPSREAIRDTERSLSAVADVLKQLPGALAGKLSAISGDEITRVFAARGLLRAAEHLRVKVSSALPPKIELPVNAVTLYGTSPRGGLTTDELDVITPETAHLYVVLVGVPEKRSAKRHAKAWLEQSSSRRMLISFKDSSAVDGAVEWFRYGTDSPVETVHFDDIELPVSQRSSFYQVQRYQVHSGPSMTPAEIKADPRPVCYTGNAWQGCPTGYLMIVLGSRQKAETFLRRVPGAVAAAVILAEQEKAEIAALDLEALGRGRHLSGITSRIADQLKGRSSEITHPAWVAARKAARAYSALSSREQGLVRKYAQADEDDTVAELKAALPLLFLAMHTYRDVNATAVDHLIRYANSLPE